MSSGAPSSTQEHLTLAGELDAAEFATDELEVRAASALYELGAVVNYDPRLWSIRHGGILTCTDNAPALCAALIRALVSNRKDGSSQNIPPQDQGEGT